MESAIGASDVQPGGGAGVGVSTGVGAGARVGSLVGAGGWVGSGVGAAGCAVAVGSSILVVGVLVAVRDGAVGERPGVVVCRTAEVPVGVDLRTASGVITGSAWASATTPNMAAAIQPICPSGASTENHELSALRPRTVIAVP